MLHLALLHQPKSFILITFYALLRLKDLVCNTRSKLQTITNTLVYHLLLTNCIIASPIHLANSIFMLLVKLIMLTTDLDSLSSLDL